MRSLTDDYSKIIEDLEKLRIKWYHSTYVIFELVNALKYRETVFMATNKKLTHRCLKINAVKFLNMNFDRYDFFNTAYMFNIYQSVARFPDMPMFSFNPETKREEQALFNVEFKRYIKAYDFFVDIDNKDLDQAYTSATKLKALFDDYKIPYTCNWSGSKGFHFKILYEDLPDKLKSLSWDELVHLFSVLAYELKIYSSVNDIDMRVYDLRRLQKAPYSVVYPYYYVVLPLSDEQFKHFKLEMVTLPVLMEDLGSIKKRGLLVRDGDPDNFLTLIKSLAEKQSLKAQLARLFKWQDKEYLIDLIELFGL